MTKLFKYPHTLHVPWSLGLQNDDKRHPNISVLYDREIVVTEKLDGENTGITRESCHCRSLDSRDHLSRHFVKSLWGKIKNNIPENMTIFMENCYAKHSIEYHNLTNYCYVFNICDGEKFLSWNEIVDYCQLLDLEHVPVLYQGKWDEEKIKDCFTGKSLFGQEQEGYVIRSISSFMLKDFENNVAKFVRKNHVQTSDHWMHGMVIQNKLKK